ncbi:hypothetical protein R5R35_012939 [Gryllus longicercus]|uniref:TAR DNA-binding protein 43 N-terminal domain-containing protein n=1 Tax=Gryllus longicercus TaxID=2509291 RepID=A0AAN9VYK8_9ORTH
MQSYLLVAEDEGEEPVEVPIEEDDTLSFSSLAAQFPGISSLKYRNPESGLMRALRAVDGRLHPPEGGWGSSVYLCVFGLVNAEARSTTSRRVKAHVRVAEDESEEPIELPVEDDGTLALVTLVAWFPGAAGLRFRNRQTGFLRGVRLIDERLRAPDGGWGDCTYSCVFSKGRRPKCLYLIVTGLSLMTTEQQLRRYAILYCTPQS